MVPLASLLPFLGGSVIKALVAGQPPGAEQWGSFTEKLLGALLVEQAQTAATLARVEEKIDQLALAAYTNPMRTGHALLQEAQRGWRKAEDRERLLHEARLRYIEAASAAPDELTGAAAKSYLAMTWLLLGSVQDTTTNLREAWYLLNGTVNRNAEIPLDQLESLAPLSLDTRPLIPPWYILEDPDAWRQALNPVQRIHARASDDAARAYRLQYFTALNQQRATVYANAKESLGAVDGALRLLGASRT